MPIHYPLQMNEQWNPCQSFVPSPAPHLGPTPFTVLLMAFRLLNHILFIWSVAPPDLCAPYEETAVFDLQQTVSHVSVLEQWYLLSLSTVVCLSGLSLFTARHIPHLGERVIWRHHSDCRKNVMWRVVSKVASSGCHVGREGFIKGGPMLF